MTLLLLGLLLAAGVILAGGLRMTGLADRIADRTGLGEALVGGALLGAATSLSGVVVSLSAALDGRASLAFSNSVGGIAAQTAFLALADLLWRKANLEHAAAELANLFQSALLLLLLALPVLAYGGPDISVLAVHPVSLVLPVLYAMGLIGTHRSRQAPMWHPVKTHETREDTDEEGGQDDTPTWRLFLAFGLLMAVMGLCGLAIARLAGELTDRTGVSASLVGALLTAVITSLPELVTTLAAVRRGALQLALGGIIGGNTFDTLFLTLSDIGYREGSLYHAIGPGDMFWLGTGMAMTGILLLGQLYRERQGPAGIGLESVGMLGLYAGAVALAAFG
ncbi:sodium:calcium antiporter [Mangrovicoccus sp. HB182678]|uniref:Sodium:calcium antiporter n=2 Tax=Mangrovicoccus algicola TaxID=2771008 RepID=A0A8J6Z2P5_9RHOB|nr:sodium:calcium antiporter [Mangrovicoccus algicola]MBE3640566.1 sodium:calcium antiporter [Mangrovicoccus algicola]